jgi:cytochrome P450
VIKQGSLVAIPIFCIHHDPRFYPEPEKFDPERFNEENKAKRHPMAFLPFGAGPRNCIGLRFGLLQAKIIIIQILLNFKLSPCSKTMIPMRIDPKNALATSLGGTWLKVEKL